MTTVEQPRQLLPGEDPETQCECPNCKEIREQLLNALKRVLRLIEDGQLRRNTSDDANPDWAMRQLPFVLAISAAFMAIDKAEGRA